MMKLAFVLLIFAHAKSTEGAAAEAVAAGAAAAEAGVSLSSHVIDLIWEHTGMAHKPYKYSIHFDASQDRWCKNRLQDGDKICIVKKPKTGEHFIHFLTNCLNGIIQGVRFNVYFFKKIVSNRPYVLKIGIIWLI